MSSLSVPPRLDVTGREQGHASAVFELSISRDTAILGAVRRFVGELCRQTLGDADVTSRVVVAAHELLDNAVRYSADAESKLRVSVERLQEVAVVAVETTNRINADREGGLRVLLEEARQSTDRILFYTTLMGRVAQREEGSGLGVARVYAESEMDLTGRFEDGVLHLRAEGRFPLDRSRCP